MKEDEIMAAMNAIVAELDGADDPTLQQSAWSDQIDAYVRDTLDQMIKSSVEHRREDPECTNYACASPPVMLTTMAMDATGHSHQILALLWAAVARLTDAEVARAGDAG